MFIKAIEIEKQTRTATSQPSILKVISIWMERRTQRQALAGLDQRLLSDIGMSNAARHKEVIKPFWQG
jgi:uncharacterized protein YjiS (DUF1127 family)